MSSMKLYTEEELRKHLYNHDESFFDKLTPIELPWDDEINDEWEVGHSDYQNGCNYGARWMRDKIQGGNK